MSALSFVLVLVGWSQVSPGAKDDEPGVAARTAEFQAAVAEKRIDAAEALVPKLAGKFAELERIIGAKGAPQPPSREAIAAAQRDRKIVLDGIERVVKDSRVAARLQTKILRQFGVLPGEGEKLALRAIKLRHIDEVPESLAAAAGALGTHRKPEYIETFEKLLNDTRVEVLKAAAGAMGEYFAEKEPVRKRIVGSMILAYQSAGSGFGPSGSEGGGQRTLVDHELRMLVRHDFQRALARLTGGVHFDSAEKWADWYRENKSSPWRDGLDHVSIKLDGLQPGPAPGHRDPGNH